LATPIPGNRARFSLGELAAATGGRLVDLDPAREIAGISTDTRALGAGQLFVAVWSEPGGPIALERDGHEFVPAARELGAVALVAANRGIEGPRLEVADSLAALGDVARRYVERETAGRQVPCLAIGGAAGKTTTKSLAHAAVRALFGPTLATEGSLNNLVGVPMTLLTLAAEHRALVIECGTSTPGEIRRLGAILDPDVALVTNVGIEHSQGLGGLDAIADEEAGLLRAARWAAVTASEEPLLLARLAAVTAPRKLTFGAHPTADVRLVARTAGADGRATLRLRVGPALAREGAVELAVASPLVGAAAAVNLTAALCGALALLDRAADAGELAAALEALAAVEAVPGRLQPRPIGSLFVLDDTYNSNPKSLAAGLTAAREIADARRQPLLLALGDMLELGELAAASHDEMVRTAAASGPRRLVLVGDESCAAAARLAPRVPVSAFADSAAAASAIGALAGEREVVLVKGSRGMRMERLVEALEAVRGAAARPT